jgi:hypothetical protein
MTPKQRLAHFMLHPYTISVLNLMILVLTYSSLKLTWFELDPSDHFHEAVELWEGFGTILLGFGVILEERGTLREIFGFHSDHHNKIEALCHDYGVFFVILGVLIETFAWLIKIPNVVLDTYEVEYALLNFAAIMAVIAAILQFRFFYRMVFKTKNAKI